MKSKPALPLAAIETMTDTLLDWFGGDVDLADNDPACAAALQVAQWLATQPSAHPNWSKAVKRFEKRIAEARAAAQEAAE